MPKEYYKLRKDLSIDFYGKKLFRIEAIKSIQSGGIKKEELGGYIESKKNLYGNAWISGDALVSGNARVYGNAWISGDALVSGNARVYGDARVYGNARVSGDARVYGDAWVYGNARVYGDALVSGNAMVSSDEVKSNTDCKNIINEKWNITILPTHIQIGCEYHSKEEWFGFSDIEINQMDCGALEWWKKWKPILIAICDYKEV